MAGTSKIARIKSILEDILENDYVNMDDVRELVNIVNDSRASRPRLSSATMAEVSRLCGVQTISMVLNGKYKNPEEFVRVLYSSLQCGYVPRPAFYLSVVAENIKVTNIIIDEDHIKNDNYIKNVIGEIKFGKYTIAEMYEGASRGNRGMDAFGMHQYFNTITHGCLEMLDFMYQLFVIASHGVNYDVIRGDDDLTPPMKAAIKIVDAIDDFKTKPQTNKSVLDNKMVKRNIMNHTDSAIRELIQTVCFMRDYEAATYRTKLRKVRKLRTNI